MLVAVCADDLPRLALACALHQLLARQHDLDDLVEEEIAAVEDQEGEFKPILKVGLVEQRQNMRDLRWIVPISRQNAVLFPCDFADILNRKGLAPVKVIEQLHHRPHLFLRLYHPMRFYDLREGHLTNSYHASPTSIGHEGSLDVVVELRKARTIGQPWRLTEPLEEQRVLLL